VARHAIDCAMGHRARRPKVASDVEFLKSDIAQRSKIGTLGARKARPIDLNGKRACGRLCHAAIEQAEVVILELLPGRMTATEAF
jgi:hypothetical protein